jgi:hypothetical protein
MKNGLNENAAVEGLSLRGGVAAHGLGRRRGVIGSYLRFAFFGAAFFAFFAFFAMTCSSMAETFIGPAWTMLHDSRLNR